VANVQTTSPDAVLDENPCVIILRLLRMQPRLLEGWLTLKYAVRLDSAVCHHGSRELLLWVEKGQLFITGTHRCNWDLDSMLFWTSSRNAHLDGICLHGDVSYNADLLRTFLIRSGSKVGWIRSSSNSTVCQQLLLEVVSLCPNIVQLDIEDESCSLQWDDCLSTLTGMCQKLTHLSLVSIRATPVELAAALSHCRGLQSIELRNHDELIPIDIALPTLTSIVICAISVTDQILAAIGERCTELRTLRVFESAQEDGECLLTDVGVRVVLRGCPQLRETDVEYAAGVSYELRLELARRCDFQGLNFAQWRDLSEELAQGVLSVSPNAVDVDFRRCTWLTDATLIMCAQYCPLVEDIVLVDCPRVTTHGVRVLVSALGSRVRSADLRGCHQLSAGAVLAIAEHCPLLERFHRPPCVSDKVLAKLVRRCVNLKM
jgi:hypothetical protein